MSDSLHIYVKTSTGKTLCVSSRSSQTIAEFKASLSETSGLSPDRMILSFKGKTLDDSCTLESYNIRVEGMVELVVKEVNPIQIYVKTETGKTLSVSVLPTDSIAAVKQKISPQAGNISTSRISLTYNKKELENSETVELVGMRKECVVGLVVKACPVAKPTPINNTNCSSSNLDENSKNELFSSFVVKEEKAIEVVFMFDTTGSMYSYLQAVRNNVSTSVAKLVEKIPNIRIAIACIGDYCDCDRSYVFKFMDFSTSAKELSNFANTCSSTGGGDHPEAYELALQRARFDFSWTEGSSRALVMIGDAPPHHPNYTDQMIDWHDELDGLVEMGVKVYAVECGGGTPEFYQELASRSGGFHLKLANISLVTDMFMAVCLREASPQKLKEFKEEVKEREAATATAFHQTKAFEMVKELEKSNVEKVEINTEKDKIARKRMHPHLDWWNTLPESCGESRYYKLVRRDEKSQLYYFSAASWEEKGSFTGYLTQLLTLLVLSSLSVVVLKPFNYFKNKVVIAST